MEEIVLERSTESSRKRILYTFVSQLFLRIVSQEQVAFNPKKHAHFKNKSRDEPRQILSEKTSKPPFLGKRRNLKQILQPTASSSQY